MDGQTTNPLTEGGGDAISLNQAIGSLLNPEAQEQKPTPAAPPERPKAQDQAPEAEPAAEEAQPEQETQDTETEEDLPPLKAPAFWKKAARDVFEQLPRQAQEQLLEQERERNEGVERALREAAEKRKSAESESSATQNERQRLKTALDQLVPDLQLAIQGKWAGVDWKKLAAEDQATYVAYQHQFREDMARLNAARSERERLAKQEAETADRARQEQGLAEWNALVSKRPELKDQTKAKAFFESITDYARETGFPPDRFNNSLSHLELLTLEKAMLYDKAQAAKAAAVVKNIPKVQAPGPAKTRADKAADERAARLKRLEQSGDLEDARGLLRL